MPIFSDVKACISCKNERPLPFFRLPRKPSYLKVCVPCYLRVLAKDTTGRKLANAKAKGYLVGSTLARALRYAAEEKVVQRQKKSLATTLAWVRRKKEGTRSKNPINAAARLKILRRAAARVSKK